MKLRFFSLLAICLATFSSGMASADGGGHKQVMPDENIIGISLLASIVAYLMISKVSKFSLNNEDKLAFSLVIFTIVVHAILGIDDLILLAGAAGFLAFGVAFFVMEIPFVEKNRTIFSYLLIIYSLAIVIFYLYQHPDLTKDGSYDSVGILTKISEIGIIALTLRKLN